MAEAISSAIAVVSIVGAVAFVTLPQSASAGASGHGSHQPSVSAVAGNCDRVARPPAQRRCENSLLPASLPMSDMGIADEGGGKASHHQGQVPLDSLEGPAGRPTVSFTLEAAMGQTVIGGVNRPILTFNGTSPGPTLTVAQGDLVEVRLVNRDVPRGVTIHWHGVDVPGAEDGVAGVTQDAVLPGRDFTYRFVAVDAGSYWYHSHQYSVDQVARGLLGALVVLPPLDQPPPASPDADLVALVHTYGGTLTINGAAEEVRHVVAAGSNARVRFINGDNGPALVSASSTFKVAALDGGELAGATEIADQYVLIPAGGRADLTFAIGETNVRIGLLFGPSLIVGPDPSATAPALTARVRFDPLVYGSHEMTPQASAVLAPPDRVFTYRVGQRKGYLDGHSGPWFTINGGIIPHVPMFMVHTGDVVEWRIINATAVPHPMHLHGHHWLVVSRNGVPSTGAQWWADSIEVDPRESYVLRMVADNPGVWMVHCHNLPHANSGLMTAMLYDSVISPYSVGRVGPRLVNHPE
jgi:FtsP/CotA-like multicopper oxidase with cupredoxin domain